MTTPDAREQSAQWLLSYAITCYVQRSESARLRSYSWPHGYDGERVLLEGALALLADLAAAFGVDEEELAERVQAQIINRA